MSAIKANQVLNLDGDRIGSVVVDSIANMKNLNPEIEANATVELLGYYSKGDGGGGTFYWDSTSIEDDNGGTIIEATGVVDGRWIRNYSGAVNVKWFGAKGDGVNSGSPSYIWTGTNDTVAFQKAFTSSADVVAPDGAYLIYDTIYPQRESSIRAYKSGQRVEIIYNANDTKDLFHLDTAPFFTFEGITLNRSRGLLLLGTNFGNIIYTKKSAHVDILNCSIGFGGVGILHDGGSYISKIVNCKINNCKSNIKLTIVNGSQTDTLIQGNTFGDVWPDREATDYSLNISSNGVRIANNYFETVHDKYSIYGQTSGQALVVSDNYFYNSGGCYMLGRTVFSGNTLEAPNLIDATMVQLRGGRSTFTGNTIDGYNASTLISTGLSVVAGKCSVSGNTFSGFSSKAISTAGGGQTIVVGNQITNCIATGISVQGTNNIITNNIIEATSYAINFGSSIENVVNGNIMVDGNTANYANKRNHFVGNIGADGKNRVISVGASPTSGTWVLGDRVYITNPIAGGTVGFICTVAGTPGTWKSFGTIEA